MNIEPFDEKGFAKKVIKVFKLMHHYEKMKHLEPFFTKAVSKLISVYSDLYYVR
jgi:hypothetical protein